MMELTEPFTCDGQTISLRLLDHLPFTNGTINYVEPRGVSVCSLHRPRVAHTLTFTSTVHHTCTT